MYDVAQNPKDKKWYVIGDCGDNYWMPVSEPYDTHEEVIEQIAHLEAADADARNCLASI